MEWKNGHQPRILGLTASYLNGRSAADFPDIFVRLTVGISNAMGLKTARTGDLLGGRKQLEAMARLWLSFMHENMVRKCRYKVYHKKRIHDHES